ncbi:MAG: TetR/AcrR family transcriptional regulator C-terminal domain-containing protein [Oscillospiraceae bacterium]|nr:TetR/AcrR family transcriptional regulator C-terminal domain-containing protein [Oscillospiraceae bacterium]
MNVKNNKRRRESIAKIERAFMELLQSQELSEITVSALCSMSGLNRSTFYANFLDVYDLADHLRKKLEEEFSELFPSADPNREESGALLMFRHIEENQLFYKTYFKLGYDESHQVMIYDTVRAEQDFGGEHIKYHIEFFRHGINAVIKLWLAGGCKESPEEMEQIIKAEYRGR